MDLEADFAIPARVWSNWKPSFGQRGIVRALTEPERSTLTRRKAELMDGLKPFAPEQRDAADIAISAMLNGFRSMRQQGDDVEGTVGILLVVLRDLPLWAIQEGCSRITAGDASYLKQGDDGATARVRLDPRWAPNDAQIKAVISELIADYKRLLDSAQSLLAAPVEIEEPYTPPPLPPLQLQPIPDRRFLGGHAQRVLADLEARARAAAEQQQQEDQP